MDNNTTIIVILVCAASAAGFYYLRKFSLKKREQISEFDEAQSDLRSNKEMGLNNVSDELETKNGDLSVDHVQILDQIEESIEIGKSLHHPQIDGSIIDFLVSRGWSLDSINDLFMDLFVLSDVITQGSMGFLAFVVTMNMSTNAMKNLFPGGKAGNSPHSLINNNSQVFWSDYFNRLQNIDPSYAELLSSFIYSMDVTGAGQKWSALQKVKTIFRKYGLNNAQQRVVINTVLKRGGLEVKKLSQQNPYTPQMMAAFRSIELNFKFLPQTGAFFPFKDLKTVKTAYTTGGTPLTCTPREAAKKAAIKRAIAKGFPCLEASSSFVPPAPDSVPNGTSSDVGNPSDAPAWFDSDGKPMAGPGRAFSHPISFSAASSVYEPSPPQSEAGDEPNIKDEAGAKNDTSTRDELSVIEWWKRFFSFRFWR